MLKIFPSSSNSFQVKYIFQWKTSTRYTVIGKLENRFRKFDIYLISLSVDVIPYGPYDTGHYYCGFNSFFISFIFDEKYSPPKIILHWTLETQSRFYRSNLRLKLQKRVKSIVIVTHMICRQMIWLISHHYDTHLMTFRKMSNFRTLFYNSPLFTSDMVAEIFDPPESRKRKSNSEIS